MNPFTVSPTFCTITYSCEMVVGPTGYDLCNFTGGTTMASFDSTSGDYSFTSNDYETFGFGS